jgi:copper chaperone CopZ
MNREKRSERSTGWTVPAAFLALTFLGSGAVAGEVRAKETLAAREAMIAKETLAAQEDPVVVDITVRGMACDMCVRALERKLSSEIEEIEDLEIHLESGKVGFRLPDGSKHTDEELRKIVRSAGFSVERIERKPDGDPGA